MEPSPASAVPAESAAVTETPSGDGKPTQEEVNSTQLTAPASPAPPPTQQCTTTTSGSPRIPEEEPSPNEPSMATPADSAVTAEDESAKEPTESVQPEKPAEVIDPLPGSSGQSPPEITTTTQETENSTEKESAGVGVIDQGQSEAMETTSSDLVPNDGEVKQDEPVLESPASTDQVNAKEAGSSSCEMSSESVPTSSSNDSEVPPSGPLPPPPPATTPPPEVESSTASPEKRTEENVDHVEPPVDAGSSAMCAVDSSSGSSPPTRDTTTDLHGGGTDGSDNVNSISTSGSCEPEESHQARAVGSGRDANDDPPGDSQPNIGSSTSAVETAVDTAAVIEDKPPPAVAGAGVVELSEGAPDQKKVNGKHEPEPSTSSEIMKTAESEKKPEARTSRSSSVHDRLSDDEDNPRQQQTNEENSSVGSSTNGNTHTLNEKLRQDTEPSESRESSTVPPEPDPGPSSSGREEPRSSTGGDNADSSRAAIESSTTSKSDKNTSEPSKDEGNVSGADAKAVGGGVVNSGRVSDYQSPSGQPTARNPLQFTEVANDEVELKVDGGHLLDRVIKLSLLKGLQDGGKRLAKSSLIISGAAAGCEGANGEATLATTSSLSKAKNAAGLRLVEESKTTPPALVAPQAAAVVPLVNGTVDTVSVRELASSSREDHQRGPPAPRVRHSSETVSSGSGELEDTRGTWHGSNIALDFREEAVGRASQNDEPQNSAVEHSTTSHDGYRRPHSRELVASSEHLPVKARKPQYYASIPDFSKQSKFSPSPPGNSSGGGGAMATSTSTAASSSSSSPAAKSLTQLHMKTPDFSRLGVVSSTATATSSTSMPGVAVSQSSPPISGAAASTTVTTNSPSNAGVRTTSELKISNPDFSKGFAFGHPGSAPGYPGSPGQQPLPPPPAGSPYVSPDTFSKLIKERNYIADLQLKNPPPSNGADAHSEGLKRSVVVDTTTHSGAVPKPSPYEPVAESSYHHHHHRGQPLDNAMDLEPQAHVIHKKSARPQPPPLGGVPKTWNPPEFSSTHFTQPQGSNRPRVSSNGSVTGGPSSSSSSSSPAPRDPSPAPSSSSASPHPGSYGAQPYPPYGGKPSHPLPPSTERIIVNNVRTYYPEQAALPTGTVPVPVGGGSSSKQTVAPPQPHYHHPGLPKVKDPEFRLDHNKEQQLLQEGTIITVKQPSYPNHIGTVGGRPQQQPTHPAAARSPSAERREAQMLQNSQEILYRDYRQHKRPSVGGGGGGSGRPTPGPLQGTPTPQGPPPPHPPANDRRSPYDAYYHPMMHHQRGPVHPQAAGPGLMHPPPPNWPGAGPTPPPPPPSAQQRGGGVVARSSPLDNGTSPVSSPAPLPPGGSIPSPTHHYYTHPQHHHTQQHGGQYKNSPSPVSGSAYGSAASPTQPMAAGKYPPPAQQPYGRSEAERDPYTKGQTPGIYKAGLDYNMEQKFAEVYQAHQEKEKQAAEAATTPGRQPSRNAPRTGGSPGGVSSASSSAAGGGPSKPVYGAYDPYSAYYHHSQATPSPTSTPSPVPSPHHRKYSGPPSRDPSPLGQQQQGAPSQQPLHHRHGSNESLYHLTPGPASVYMHSGPPRDPAANGSHDPRGGGVQQHQQQTAGIPYHANQPSSSSTYPMPTPYGGAGVAIPPSASNPPQHSVINAAYDRHYQPAPHPSYGGSSSSQSSQGNAHHGKSLPYPPGRQPQHQQPLQPPPPQPQAGPVPASANGGVSVPSSAPSSSYSYPHHPPIVAAASESAVIHPPVGSKNIPVRVIATAPPASKVAGSGQQHTLSNSARPTGGVGASSSMASSQGVVRGVAGGATGGGGDERGVTADGVGTVTAVIIAPAKRESPLDLSVKTVKTKADSTGCDDYGNVSASNSSISSSSSSSSSSTSSSGGSAALLATQPNSRSRGGEVVPKVDFNPNFNKHIPPSPHSSGRGSTPGGGPPPVASGGRPSDPLPGPPPPRHVSVISPAIPPGYDKTTDAYMSAKYRAVGGPLVTPVLHYSPHYPLPPHGAPAGYDPAAPPGNSSKSQADPYSSPKQQPGSGQPGPASGSGSASSKSVYYSPAATGPTHPGMSNAPHQPTMDYMRGGKPLGGSIITGQALPSGSRAPALPPPPSASANQHQGAVAAPPPSRPDDARSEDRKFVENMLKKKTSPSSDVIADLQSGRFPTRLPQSLVPKKRAAAAAAAAAAAEAAQSKAASGGSPNVPSPAKMGKYEEREQPGHEAATPGYQPVQPQNAPKDGLYGHTGAAMHGPAKPYGTGENLQQLGGGSKRTETAVHPSVITTNYHHQQQQQHQQQQYPPDMRYYPHQQPVGPSKPREDPVAPVYHQPHLRGGSSLPYGHAYHPQYHHSEHPQHLGAYPQHKDPSGQPMFRYSEPPKSSPESTSVQHMQSHIHYTGSAGVPGGKEYQHQHQQQQHPPPHHLQQQSLPSPLGKSGGIEVARSAYVPPPHSSPYGGGVPPPPAPVPVPSSQHPQHHRGADQAVISKLRTSLELKEFKEKQRISQLRKLPSGDPVEEPPVHSNPPTTPVTPDAPSSSARFRTKGELKGYTPLPLPPSVPDPSKQEGDAPKDHEGGVGGGGKTEMAGTDAPLGDGAGAATPLLDILDWGSACNEFVEQLQTGKKRGRRKRSSTTTPVGGRGWHGLGQDGGELMATVGDGSSADLSAVPKDVLNSARSPPKQHRLDRSGSVSSSDEDKPLLLLRQQSQQQQQQHQHQHRDEDEPDPRQQHMVVDSHTRNMLLSTVEKLTDKLARNMREKQRLELEQKHEAKLGRSSSTDSDTARLASAAAQRAKARVRKLRHRSSIVSSSVLKSSDGDGDVTADEDETIKAGGGKRPLLHSSLANSSNAAKRKRLERRSSSASSSESEQPEVEPEVVRRKRGRPKGSLGGAKRAQQQQQQQQQQATMTRCQTSTLKQDPNENSDLSSDDDKTSKALRTPPVKGERNASSHRADSTKKGGGGGGGGAGNGGTSGGSTKSGGQQVKVDNSTTGDGKAKKKSNDNHDNGTPRKSEEPSNSNGSSGKKPPAKPRTTSRSKTPVVQGQGVNSSGGSSSSSSSSSSASSSSSSSSSSSEAEDRETMTRSKSKREAERRRSNSKVLRNDKIVENLSATVNHRRARIENERTPTKQKQTKNSRETPASSAGKRSKPAESDSDPSAVTTTTPAAVSAEKATGVPRKRTRQASKNGPSSSVESDQGSSSDDEGTAVAPGATDLNERLRKRRSKNGSEQAGGKGTSKGNASVGKGSRSRRESTATKSGREESSAKKKQPTASGAASAGSSSSGGGGRGGSRKGSVKDGGTSTGPADHFYPGWEKELYEYKRSLKVPPELITIGGGLYMHRISTSLPDLDSPHHSDGSETFSEIVKKLNQKEEAGGPPNVSTPPAPKRIKTKAAAKQQQPPTAQACGQAVKVKEERPESLTEQRKKKLDGNEKFSSIIELLHRRCLAAALLQQGKAGTGGSTAAAGTGKQKGSSKGASAKANVNNNNNNNNEITVKPKQEYELLPTPGAESESLFAKNCKKKKSLFDTAILKSRTRTEQKAMQSKEMIREVFGADEERPQSAPPLGCGGLFEEGIHNVTYDEKYNELMRNVDRIVGELDGSSGVAVSVKQEPDEEQEEDDGAEDDEDDERMRVEGDDETQDSSVLMKDSERDTPSVASERDLLGGTPLSFKGLTVASTPGPPGATVVASTSTGVVGNAVPEKKRRGRGHRTSRRKGSSGFDYIRKKKKPSQQHHNNQANGSNHHRGGFGASSSNINGMYGGIHGESRKKPMSAFERLEVKDETHINKEIRSWVLNKGVGESVMHKAARLGYTDVIVYCLERLDMDPDLKDNAGYTPLHEACAKGHLDIANYLLQYGASHSEPAPSGMRPLHEAVENSFIEIVRLLLSFGADPMLTTYNGSTPEQLAESDSMIRFLQDHLNDVQSIGPTKTAWKFDGPWKMHDAEESGYNVFSHIPDFDGEDSGISSLNTSAGSTSTGTSGNGTTSCSSGERRCDSNSNIMNFEEGNPKPPLENGIPADATIDGGGSVPESPVAVGGSVGLRNGKVMKRDPQKDANTLVNGFLKGENRTKLPNGVAARSGEDKCKPADGLEDAQLHDDDNENDGLDGSDGMVFEYEESDRPLPPLYALKDEHNERWVLLSDLCPLLKFKSKEAVLRQICPNNSVINQRDLIREMKFEEFLTRAHCLQLLCAGEKLNIHASKVVLVKYNDSVKSLLQVKSMMTRI